MSRCDPVALGIAKSTGIEVLGQQHNANLVMNPNSPYFKDLHKDIDGFKSGQSRGIVYSIEEKIGMTMHKNVREEGHPVGTKLYPIAQPDGYTPLSVDTSCREKVMSFWVHLSSHQGVAAPLRLYYDSVVYQGLCDFGVGRNCFLQLTELGAQCEFNKTGQRAEFVTFDQKKWDGKVEYVLDDVNAMADFCENVLGGVMKGRPQRATGSWKPDHDLLSSQVTATEAIVGKEWEDALPFPADPGGEVFSTAYTVVAQAGGRRVIRLSIHRCKFSGGILYLDRNEKPLFPNWGIKAVLEEFGYKAVMNFGKDAIVMW
ncbi:MAG: hypothetical protein SGARI_007427, partial [Bacillariaceae sp.]